MPEELSMKCQICGTSMTKKVLKSTVAGVKKVPNIGKVVHPYKDEDGWWLPEKKQKKKKRLRHPIQRCKECWRKLRTKKKKHIGSYKRIEDIKKNH